MWYTNCCPLGIHDGALIGMGSTLLDNCEVGEGSIVAAGALVLQNTKIPAGEIWGGVPAKYLKPVRPGQSPTQNSISKRERNSIRKNNLSSR